MMDRLEMNSAFFFAERVLRGEPVPDGTIKNLANALVHLRVTIDMIEAEQGYDFDSFWLSAHKQERPGPPTD